MLGSARDDDDAVVAPGTCCVGGALRENDRPWEESVSVFFLFLNAMKMIMMICGILRWSICDTGTIVMHGWIDVCLRCLREKMKVFSFVPMFGTFGRWDNN